MKRLLAFIFYLTSFVAGAQTIQTYVNGEPMGSVRAKINGNFVYLHNRLDSLIDNGSSGSGNAWPLSGIGDITGQTQITSSNGSDLFLGLDEEESTGVNNLYIGALGGTYISGFFRPTGSFIIRDNVATFQDDSDPSKQLTLQLSGITTGTTRTLTVPNSSGTIATEAFALPRLGASGLASFGLFTTGDQWFEKTTGDGHSRLQLQTSSANMRYTASDGLASAMMNLGNTSASLSYVASDNDNTGLSIQETNIAVQSTDLNWQGIMYTTEPSIYQDGTLPSLLYLRSKNLTATTSLNFPSTATNLSADLTITVTGAAVGDVVALGVPHTSVVANSCYTAWVSSTNTVTVRFNNYGAATQDPAQANFKVKVLKDL